MVGLVKFERVARRDGGTLSVTIPPEVQHAVGMKEGSHVEIVVTDDGKIVIEVKRV